MKRKRRGRDASQARRINRGEKKLNRGEAEGAEEDAEDSFCGSVGGLWGSVVMDRVLLCERW
jgi:hypothetical protein